MILVFPLLLVITSCAGEGTPVIAIEVTPLCVGADELMNPQQFNATIFVDGVKQSPDPDNSAVTWSVLGGDVNGTISNSNGSEGQYIPPDTVPPPASEVTIIATSNEDSQKQGQATVVLTGPCPDVPPPSIEF